jgi:hypothetical protein
MSAICYFQTSVPLLTRGRYKPEDWTLHSHRRDNLENENSQLWRGSRCLFLCQFYWRGLYRLVLLYVRCIDFQWKRKRRGEGRVLRCSKGLCNQLYVVHIIARYGDSMEKASFALRYNVEMSLRMIMHVDVLMRPFLYLVPFTTNLFNDATGSSGYTASNVRVIMEYWIGRMWKETAVF